MIDISEGVGDMGISIDKPVGGVPASKPRPKKKKSKHNIPRKEIVFLPQKLIIM
jgi:hypothetical protein